MDRIERFYRIDQLLKTRRVVPVRVFHEELQVSPATFKRDLEYMRERLHAPIEWDRELGGYRWGAPDPHAPQYQLPGLWFNPAEIYALITMHQLLTQLEPGLIGAHVGPLRERLDQLLETGRVPAEAIRDRVRILHMARRRLDLPHFGLVARALLSRQRLRVSHYNRDRDETLQREISPQRLVHYRDNWYLDAWCHLRKGLRSFAVDAIREAELLEEKARELPERELDEVLSGAYGIFSGRPRAVARLRFSAARARWVAAETWHSQQKGSFDDAGRYLLEIPYSDDRELVMDILRHGPEVEVLGPPELRRRVGELLHDAAAQYPAGAERRG